MIKKINKLKNCGIFRNFKWTSSLDEFGKKNLIYGLNGSGKSTLSQALSYFNDPIADTQLGNYEIEIIDDSGTIIGNKLTSKLANSLYVFNKDFINRNIKTFDTLGQIIYLSEENIEVKGKIESLKIDLKELQTKKKITSKNYEEVKTIFEKILPEIAKKMKNFFQNIGGYCAKYGNYNKTNIEFFLEKNENFLDEDFGDKEFLKDLLQTSLKEEVLPIVQINFQKININQFKELIKTCLEFLSRNIRSLTISNYSSELLKWIEEGLFLHKNDCICLFCGQGLSLERKKYLNALFDDEYKKFKSEVVQFIQDIEKRKINQIEYNFYIYAEFREKVSCSIAYVNNHINNYNAYLSELQKLLQLKLDKIEQIDFQLPPDINIEIMNAEIDLLIQNIILNNEKTEKFISKQQEDLLLLEKLLLSRYLKENNYKGTLLDLNKKTLEDNNVESKIIKSEEEITLLENEIRDVLKATVNFNNLLHQFLGRAEIELVFDEESKGYRLIRIENKYKAERLSDGEKAAIALIYFLIKVQENGNKIENTIIILDDPISSLDSNNLFNAYSFIVSIFEKAHQFFVLTHNFMFFSLLRRKFSTRNEPDKFLYIIANNVNMVRGVPLREAFIATMPHSLKHLNSEYAYCFKQTYDFINRESVLPDIDLNEFFVISNCCRKLLETFCSFKLLNKNFDVGLVKKLYKLHKDNNYILSLEEKTKAEKLFKFVNYYSHGSSFTLSSEMDVIIGETKNIAREVINLIKYADEVHYNELLEHANK